MQILPFHCVIFYSKSGDCVRHLWQGDKGEHSHCSEHDGGDQHDHGRPDVGAEEGDGSQPAARCGNDNRVSIATVPTRAVESARKSELATRFEMRWKRDGLVQAWRKSFSLRGMVLYAEDSILSLMIIIFKSCLFVHRANCMQEQWFIPDVNRPLLNTWYTLFIMCWLHSASRNSICAITRNSYSISLNNFTKM